MSCSSEYSPQLRSLGFRVTSQRLAILHVLRRAAGHLSPVVVHSRARRMVPGITRPTVYRTLEFLRKTGFVWRTDPATGQMAYELAQHQHHHLACRRCGMEVQLGDAVIDAAYRRLETSSRFRIDHEHLSLTGLCWNCLKAMEE